MPIEAVVFVVAGSVLLLLGLRALIRFLIR